LEKVNEVKELRVLIILINILLISCATTKFNINNVNFTFESSQQDILPLKYHDRSSANFETAEKLMKNILTTGDEAWGYYYIDHSVSDRERRIFEFNLNIVGAILASALSVIGIPEARVRYDLNAIIYLFDSNGNIIGIYEKSSSIVKSKGLYYGRNYPIEEIGKKFKTLFTEVISNMDHDKERINKQLELSGTIKAEGDAELYTKIYKLMK
jgi:hypothetical protein